MRSCTLSQHRTGFFTKSRAAVMEEALHGLSFSLSSLEKSASCCISSCNLDFALHGTNNKFLDYFDLSIERTCSGVCYSRSRCRAGRWCWRSWPFARGWAWARPQAPVAPWQRRQPSSALGPRPRHRSWGRGGKSSAAGAGPDPGCRRTRLKRGSSQARAPLFESALQRLVSVVLLTHTLTQLKLLA